MGFKTFGFGGGRADIWEPEEDIYWGPETDWLGDKRYTGDRELANPLAAVQMGLIYVNPEGPNGNPDPVASARDIRETFARMAMNDEETVALVAGGHTFGKAHGAGDASTGRSASPRARDRGAGPGLEERAGQRQGRAHHHQRHRRRVEAQPDPLGHGYFETLFGYEWELTEEPGGRAPVAPQGRCGGSTVPDAHDPSKRHAPMMTTADMALRMDPIYEQISRRFLAESAGVRRRLRAGLVQAHPPRHGPARALPRRWCPKAKT
jgi:catalase-peroxidase